MRPFTRYARFTLPALLVAAAPWVSFAAQSPYPPPERRFEFELRELVFRGLDGDVSALEEALERCEAVLDEDPDNAEALVWHGSTSLALSGAAYSRGDLGTGGALWQRGLAEMERAVELAPEDIAVLIPRAAALLGAARNIPFPQQARDLTRTAIIDYEKVYELQRPYFSRMSEHARGELLLGLADAHHRLDQDDEVLRYLRLVRAELPGTDYARHAEEYIAAEPEGRQMPIRICQGCHGDEGSGEQR